MAQLAVPISDTTKTSVTGVGDTINLYNNIDESIASDTDFIYGANNVAAVYQCKLSPVTNPNITSDHVVNYRLGKTNNGTNDSAGNAVTVTVALYCGTTLIASSTAITVALWTTGSFTLTLAQAAAITDYSNLQLRFTTSASGGTTTTRRGGAVSWANLSVPDVVTPTLENLFAYSENLLHSSYSRTAITVAQNSAGYNGVVPAFQITDAAGTYHNLYNDVTLLDSTTDYTFSLDINIGTCSSVMFAVNWNTTNTSDFGYYNTFFDPVNGVSGGFNDSTNCKVLAQSSTSLGNSWYRLFVTVRVPSLPNMYLEPKIWLCNSGTGNGSNYAFASTGTFYLYTTRWQLNRGAATSYVKAPNVAAYNLTAQKGTFIVTGSVATLKTSRNMVAANSSYSLSGNTAAIRAYRTITADKGNYSLIGNDTVILANRKLSVNNGSYQTTGSDVTLTYKELIRYILDAASGIFQGVGNEAELLVNRILSTNASNYTATGRTGDLKVNRNLQTETSNYSLQGGDVTTLLNRILGADKGDYLLHGYDVRIIFINPDVLPEIITIAAPLLSVIEANTPLYQFITATTKVNTIVAANATLHDVIIDTTNLNNLIQSNTLLKTTIDGNTKL